MMDNEKTLGPYNFYGLLWENETAQHHFDQVPLMQTYLCIIWTNFQRGDRALAPIFWRWNTGYSTSFAYRGQSTAMSLSKLNFRARSLDAQKSMPVYIGDEIPALPDFTAINRAVPQMPTGMEKEEETVRFLMHKIKRSWAAILNLARKKRKLECSINLKLTHAICAHNKYIHS